ncbi:MAG: YceI family protein, partial [Rhodobacterales bacterium]
NLSSPTTAELTGKLTMAGNTHLVTLDVTFNGGGKNPITQVDTLGFSATGQFKRSDFGLGAWIPAVGDDVTLDIEAEFVRRGR